jgi:hypothetical protein
MYFQYQVFRLCLFYDDIVISDQNKQPHIKCFITIALSNKPNDSNTHDHIHSFLCITSLHLITIKSNNYKLLNILRNISEQKLNLKVNTAAQKISTKLKKF